MRVQSAFRGILLVALALLMCGAVRSQVGARTGHPSTTGWKDLFASDLSNAMFDPGSWVMENGILSAKTGGTIWTKESYGNFILDLEFKVSKGANSGVFLRAGDLRNILSALEVQIHESTDEVRDGRRNLRRKAAL